MMTDTGAPAPSTSLAPRLIKGLQAEYIPATWPGENTSGLRVFGNNVLVRMDECSSETTGGVMLLPEMVDRMNEASESGCIYAVGPGAFTIFDDGRRWDGDRPEVGERVYVEKYAGIKAMGADGALYRVMSDRCIGAGMIAPTPKGE